MFGKLLKLLLDEVEDEFDDLQTHRRRLDNGAAARTPVLNA